MLNLHRLELLRHFASSGSITATAHQLGYTASAVSQQLTVLEREAGVSLIERTAHTASLTDAGQELAEHAGIVLTAAEEAQSRMRARAATVSGQVDIYCIPGVATDLAPSLAELQRVHPLLSIVARETSDDEAAAAVLDGQADLAVVDNWTEQPLPDAAGLVQQVLAREPVLLAVRDDHPDAGRSTPVGDSALRVLLTDNTWLCAPEGLQSRMAGDRRLDAAGIDPHPRWEFEGMQVLAALVAADAGLTFLPTTVIDAQPGIAGLPVRPRLNRRLVAFTRRSKLQDPALAACLETARAALGPR